MDINNKILLNSVKLPDNVNVNTQIQFGLNNTNKPIPLNDIDTTVSQFEQFEKERKECTRYRFYGVVKPVVTNVLFNENIKIYVKEPKPIPNVSPVPQIVAKTIMSSSIFEKDGWVGSYNDEPNTDEIQYNDNKSALCEFFPFDPGYDRLKMLDSDGASNYLLKIVYPFNTRDITLVKNNSNISLKDGIPIIDQFTIDLNGRQYTGFRTPMNHGLNVGDKIRLYNFVDNTPNNTLNLTTRLYRVFKLGNQVNDNKLRTFVIDVNPSDIDFTLGISTLKRSVNNKLSSYYVRRFKSLTSSDYKDYDLYPAAYGVTYFNDEVVAFNFKNDIDVSSLVDNLGRPITELYLSILKNDNDSNPASINTQYWLQQQQTLPPPYNIRFWTKISAGYKLEDDSSVNYNIKSYGDTTYQGSTYYENIDESDNIFDGDIVEYNESELLERRLENVYHRVNTVYREFLNSIDSNKRNKREGYLYTPFNLIKIRELSNYINPVVNLQLVIDRYNITNPIEIDELRKSFQIPDYATEIAPNVFKWRDLLEIGEFDNSGAGVDYPFESGAHYIYLDKRFYFQRQDPPCEFSLISEDIVLGASDVNNVQQDKLIKLLNDPTFLNYTIDIPATSLVNVNDNTTVPNPQSGLIVFNTNPDIVNGVGVGYYQFNGNNWTKVIFTLDVGSANTLDILNYNGLANLNIEVTLADYIGEYELGKRDVAGGCLDLSFLKQKEIDDVC
jgi:hypothetical protein